VSAIVPSAAADARPVVAAQAKTELIDINRATAEELMTMKGIGEARAKAIIKGRPYARKDDLVRKKVVPLSIYDDIKDKIVAKQSAESGNAGSAAAGRGRAQEAVSPQRIPRQGDLRAGWPAAVAIFERELSTPSRPSGFSKAARRSAPAFSCFASAKQPLVIYGSQPHPDRHGRCQIPS
jgi:type II secretory pathway component PulK